MAIWYQVEGRRYKSLPSAAARALVVASETRKTVHLIEYEFATARVISAIEVNVRPSSSPRAGDVVRG